MKTNIHIHSELMAMLMPGIHGSILVREALDTNLVFNDFSTFKKEEDTSDYRNEERAFFRNVISVVQKNVADESFNYNQFAFEMNVSKSTLHRKINQFTGLTPCKFVLSFRIQIAQQLLLNNSLNISEVAYQAGFNDPRYFSRCFRTEVGLSPKEYRESLKVKEINSEPINQFFLEKAIEKLETKISDSNLSLDQFANEMNVSKTSLYRKLKSATGISPCEFIRSVRIKRSAHLLGIHRNISDVAIAVGFNDSKYFSRCFKSEFGVTPTQYQELLVS